MQPIEELRYLVLAAQREGNRLFTEALRPFDLTPSQAEVLRVLQEHQPLSLIALGDLLVCENGSPSRLVNGLVEANLVKRLPSLTNGRMVTLTLTETGEETATRVKAAEEALYAFIAQATEGQSISEAITLLWGLVQGRPGGEAIARRKQRKANETL